MPTRKQRRRREKSFRHEYEYVLVDDEGNEVVVPDDERRDDRGDDGAATTGDRSKRAQASRKSQQASGKSQQKSRQPARMGRQVQPASWRRVGRRALIFAPLMFVVVSILDNGLTPAQHAIQTVVLLAFFLPFSYVMDTVAYRMYLKRTARTAEQKAGPKAAGRQRRELEASNGVDAPTSRAGRPR